MSSRGAVSSSSQLSALWSGSACQRQLSPGPSRQRRRSCPVRFRACSSIPLGASDANGRQLSPLVLPDGLRLRCDSAPWQDIESNWWAAAAPPGTSATGTPGKDNPELCTASRLLAGGRFSMLAGTWTSPGITTSPSRRTVGGRGRYLCVAALLGRFSATRCNAAARPQQPLSVRALRAAKTASDTPTALSTASGGPSCCSRSSQAAATSSSAYRCASSATSVSFAFWAIGDEP